MVGYGNLEHLINTGVDIVSLIQPDDDEEHSIVAAEDAVLVDEKLNKLTRPTSLLLKQNLELQRSLSTPPHERVNNKQILEMYISRSKKKYPQRLSWQPVAIGSFTPQGSRRYHDLNDTKSMYVVPGGRDSVLLAGDSMLNLETCSNHGSNLTIHSVGVPSFSAHLLHTAFPKRTRSSSIASAVSVSVLDLEMGQLHGDVSNSFFNLHGYLYMFCIIINFSLLYKNEIFTCEDTS